MRILLITGTYKPSINGVAISVEVMSKNLVKMGHKIMVLAPANSFAVNNSSFIIRYPSLNNIFVKDYPIPLFPLTPNIYKKITKFKPDIVHVHHPFHIGFFANYISDLFKIPLVFTYHTKHDYYSEEYLKFLPKEIKSKYIVGSVLDFCKKCDLVIAPSNEIKAYLKINKVESVVIPSIVDDLSRSKISKKDLRTKLGLSIDKKLLLFVGRLAIEKNIKLLVETATKLNKNYTFILCGTGPIEDEIKNKIKKLDIEDKFLVLGKKDRSVIGEYYQASDYFCYPSISETQGLIYWEALSFGLPIVSVDSSVAREWVRPEFGILSKDSSNQMYKNIIRITKSDYTKMSKAAFNFSKKFSSKRSAKKMIEEYSKLL